jgi:hypothetical protein
MYALLVLCYKRGFKLSKAHEFLNRRGKCVTLGYVQTYLPKVIDCELSLLKDKIKNNLINS